MLRHKFDNNVQVLYTENYILMMKEGKKDVNRDIPCPWGRRLTVVKISALKIIQRHHESSIKTSAGSFL